MLLQDKYIGKGAPFEGDLTLWLRSLPASAKVIKATIQLSSTPYTGAIDLTVPQPILGVTKAPGLSDPPTSFVEVNLHARRILVSVDGTSQIVATGDSGSPSLQVDMGGIYISIADDGTILAPGKTAWTVPFPTVLLTAPTSPSLPEPLPGLTVSKFRLSLPPPVAPTTKTPLLYVTKVTISSVPMNVSVRVGQLPPFWTHLGELSTTDTSPDFAMVLNAVLATAKTQNGFYAVPFIIHSDTLAQIDATVQIEYVIDLPVLPSYLPEVTMSYAFSPQPELDPSLKVMLPRGAVPVADATKAQARGEFQPTRVALRSDAASAIVANVVVSPDCALAQPLQSATEIALTGIDLPLSTASPGFTGLSVAIQADNDGKPSGQVFIRAELVVGKPLPDQSVWGSATLPAPFRVLANQNYWLVLESLIGQAAWLATPGTSTDRVLQCSRDGGLSWRVANAPEALAPLAAQFRLRNIPTSFTIPIQLDIGARPGDVLRRLDEFAPLGRVELNFGFGDALGTYITNLVTASPSPCGTDDLVINGDFSTPPPDDAAMKLFGVENKQGGMPFTPTVSLGPRINLSVERFVTLSYDTSPPSVQPTRIDCAGANPAQTTPDEVKNAINHAVGQQITSFPSGSLTLVNEAVLYPWCKNEIPAGWQGTLNQTYRLKIPEPDGTNRLVVLLADPASLDQSFFINQWDISYACFPIGGPLSGTSSPGEARLSQRIPVAAGCAYQLSIGFLVESFDLSGIDATVSPSWGVTWLDTNGNTLRTDNETFDLGLSGASNATAPSYVEVLLTAPANAVNANLNFINFAPDAYTLILATVSFTPTLQSVRNGRFQQWGGQPTDRSPAGWTLKSGVLGSEGQQVEIKLRGDSSEDTILSQRVDVVAGDSYKLRVDARPETPLQSDPGTLPNAQRARLELQWLINGQPGDTIILTLDGRSFSESVWAGKAPDGATQAEIRLIQPKGSNKVTSNLLVTSVILDQTDLVSVPLVFLSDAPGQLTVSQMHVVYDTPEAPKPSRRTSIAASNGGGTKTTVAQMVVAADSKAGSTMVPTPQPQPTTIPETGTAAVTTQVPQAPQPSQAPAASILSLTSILGIGEARAKQLKAVGIDSLEKLATATPEYIMQTLKGVVLEVAIRFIKEAQQLIAPPSPGPIS